MTIVGGPCRGPVTSQSISLVSAAAGVALSMWWGLLANRFALDPPAAFAILVPISDARRQTLSAVAVALLW